MGKPTTVLISYYVVSAFNVGRIPEEVIPRTRLKIYTIVW